MKKIALLSAIVLAAASLFSCSEEIQEAKKDYTENKIEKMEDASKDFARGKVSGSTYTTDFGGISFTAPAGWVYSTDEELMTLMGEAIDSSGNNVLNDAELTKKLLEKTTIYDMMVADPNAGTNVSVMFENIPLYGLDPDEMTVSKYIDLADAQFDASAAGMTFSAFSDEKTVSLGGESFTLVSKTGTYTAYDITFTQNYYIRKVDDFMMAIIVTAFTDEELAQVEACFSSAT